MSFGCHHRSGFARAAVASGSPSMSCSDTVPLTLARNFSQYSFTTRNTNDNKTEEEKGSRYWSQKQEDARDELIDPRTFNLIVDPNLIPIVCSRLSRSSGGI